MSSQRNIVHFDLDTFFISVERLENSSLIGKPVVIGGTGDRGVVASCSYEARKLGITPGLSIKVARRTWPEVILVPGNGGKYGKYSDIVTSIIREKMPLVEKASVDEFYVDMTGMDHNFGVVKYSNEVREYIMKQTGLPLSMGTSENKTVSKVATGEAKPNGRFVVDHGREKSFLAPLSIQRLPSIGGKTYNILRQLGIERIGTLQQIPRQKLETVLGENGNTIWTRAQGIYNTPIISYHERKSVGISRTFRQDTIDAAYLRTVVMAMATELAFELRKGNRMCACVSVNLKYSDLKEESKQKSISYTSYEDTIIHIAVAIFDTLFARRQLVRLVGVTCSKLVIGSHQMNLLEDSSEKIRLLQEIDYLKKKYHDTMIVTRAAIMEHDNLDVMGDTWNGDPGVPPPRRHL